MNIIKDFKISIEKCTRFQRVSYPSGCTRSLGGGGKFMMRGVSDVPHERCHPINPLRLEAIPVNSNLPRCMGKIPGGIPLCRVAHY